MKTLLLRRRGLSYLEVLIAASIGLVGLLGAVALFPVAISQMQRGLEADSANAIGEAAVHQAETLGIRNPKTWMFYTSTTGTLPNQNDWLPVEHFSSLNGDVRYAQPNEPAFQEYGNRSWNKGIKRLASFCIDPRMLSEMIYQRGGGTATATETNSQLYWQFPYVPKNVANEDDIFMFRVSLQNPLTNGPLTKEQARLFFRSPDDLLFDRERKDSFGFLPARQVFMQDSTQTKDQRRDYMPEYEWMATLVPKFNGSAVAGSDQSIVQSGEYVLSVIVFHNRRVAQDTILVNRNANENFIEDERVCDVVQFYGNGVGGGDVLIRSRQHASSSNVYHDADTNVRENDWVLLGRMVKVYDPAGMAAPQVVAPIFQWYRVTGVQGEPTGLDTAGNPIAGSTSTPYFRSLTLQGGDWQVGDANDPVVAANAAQTNPNLKPSLAKMVLVTGVVGVFERTIRLE